MTRPRPDHDLECPQCKNKDTSPIPEGPECSAGCGAKMEWDVVDYDCAQNPIRPFVRRLAEQRIPVQINQIQNLAMNSYEREFLLPSLSDEALLERCEHAIKNSAPLVDPRLPAHTYDEACIHRLMPEIMRRLARRHS
jgi:hypothetical protein